MKGRPSMPSGIFHRAERDHLNLSDLVNARLKRLQLAGEEPCELFPLFEASLKEFILEVRKNLTRIVCIDPD